MMKGVGIFPGGASHHLMIAALAPLLIILACIRSSFAVEAETLILLEGIKRCLDGREVILSPIALLRMMERLLNHLLLLLLLLVILHQLHLVE